MDIARTLAQTHPAIFSHHLHQNALVSDILQNGIQHGLRNRLCDAATAELASLMSILQDVHLNQEVDSRTILDDSKFSTRNAYLALQDNQNEDTTSFI
jgi:hypothetical protein